MSQFSQKYYKHYYVSKKRDVLKEVDIEEKRGFWYWTRHYRIFEIIIIFLLLLILYCLCIRGGIGLGLGGFSLGSGLPYGGVSTQTTQSTQHKSIQKEEQRANTNVVSLGEKYPTKVLPDAQKLIPKGDTEVTLDDYMYYVNDTKQGYPKFIDPKTNRLIKDKKPPCYEPQCPINAISKQNQQDYANWLSSLTQQSYSVEQTSNGFKLLK